MAKSSKMAEEKTWNQQLNDWYDSQKVSIGEKALWKKIKDNGLTVDGVRRYRKNEITCLEKVTSEKKNSLYALTGLEIFRVKPPYIPIGSPRPSSPTGSPTGSHMDSPADSYKSPLSDVARQAREGIDKIVSQASSGLSGMQKLKEGLLKAQQYDANQRADAIMELLDVLSEEVDYFRTASETDKKVLIQRLQKEPESFGYVSQILNVLYQGKAIDSWMLMAQPPLRIKRMKKGEK